MNQKVICDRAHKCDERKNECGHSEPHEIQVFGKRNGKEFNCTHSDECLDYNVRCVPVGIDFEIEELFSL